MADTATDFVPVDDELLPSGGWVEGGRLVRDITEYERSAAARAKCLEHYGATCVACGFSAGAVYGELVGQIVHVHHLRPLSEIGDRYAVDPVRDLRPVCPNCHAAIHARVPPFSIDEVRSMLNARSRKGAY
ncbi:MAG: HNH endonuclease [Rubrivivax sp.]|nr:HNH endonuclease [Rubrivivax sp.]